MPRPLTILAAAVLVLVQQTASGEQPAGAPQSTPDPDGGDGRQLVSMPEEARELMRQDMLDHLSTLNDVMGLMIENKLDAAADVAEKGLGKSSMGKHRATGMGPGRFMPLEMRNIGWSMHEAATEFSQIARQGDSDSAYVALQKVTGFCVSCHYRYRTQ